MERIKNILSCLFLILLIVTSVSLYNSKTHIEMQDDDINVLMEEIGRVEDRLDSVSRLLTIERLRYDSLCNELDSSEIRYDNIIKRYNIRKEQIKYLNADESINFLHKELKSYD